MSSIHLFAIIPLLILFIATLVFRRTGLLHLLSLGYAFVLGYVAVIDGWELLFFVPCVGVGLISLILFTLCMLNGDWL